MQQQKSLARVAALQTMQQQLETLADRMEALGLDSLAQHIDSITADLDFEIEDAMPVEATVERK